SNTHSCKIVSVDRFGGLEKHLACNVVNGYRSHLCPRAVYVNRLIGQHTNALRREYRSPVVILVSNLKTFVESSGHSAKLVSALCKIVNHVLRFINEVHNLFIGENSVLVSDLNGVLSLSWSEITQ